MRRIGILIALIVLSGRADAQEPGATVHVEVRAGDEAAEGADVVVGGARFRTDRVGRVTVSVRPGNVRVLVVKEGFVPASVLVSLGPGGSQTLVVELQREPAIEEHVTVVGATRTGKRLEDQPLRVEVLSRDEVEEKMLMTPGDIVMMLNEMGGMRVQATSPSLGAASVRIQGMRGRYTRVLSDGLPLHGDVGGIGLLQIPPMDLGQVEVIKGVASALHGAGAMAGVVNLMSRRPEAEAEREFLFNRSMRGATDAVAFFSGTLSRGWSASMLGGGHWHARTDADDDGWADLAGYDRGVLRPRVFWDPGRGRSLFATVGLTHEDRTGGTIEGRRLAGAGEPYVESLGTRRYDAGAVAQFLLKNRYVVTARGSVVRQRHQHRLGELVERDRHLVAFGEVAVRGSAGTQTWVAGLAIERDVYRPADVPRFAYAFTVPGAFVVHDLAVSSALSISTSGRVDVHSEYGTFFSPRVSALARKGRWTSRLSLGTGFFASTPLTEETEAAGLSRLTVPVALEAERGLSGSFDLSRTDGPLSYTATVFASRVTDPLHVDRSTYTLRNLHQDTSNLGVELLGTLRREPWALTASYTYVRSREVIDGRADQVPLTPRHSAGIVGMWEREDVGRAGIEWYYTGAQRLDENPFRTASEPYVVVGLLIERQLGRVRLFVNGENLTGTRQTTWDPLLRPRPGADGRRTVDAWAPLEGRNINGGLRLRW